MTKLSPLHVMPIQQLLDLIYEQVLRDLDLQHFLFLEVFVSILFDCRKMSAKNKILYDDLWPCRVIFLVRALNNYARRVTPISIFQLIAHVLGIAEIKLGANTRTIRIGRVNGRIP